ncbi:translocation/assembly module TamB domain-containing protein [uncultured Legionella sp.]|uniref:translocation/assembly module TamB domain-containing protein n=1 Tax=uncultured Legionella sp. TaxID=210934 RepID=UPI0026260376|nr:translocation/assembly module TamB domain-containing protein [uncultured Legionella sp.]
MIKLLKRLYYTSLILLISIGCLLAFLLTTTPGLYTALKLSKIVLPGTLKIQKLQGQLANQFYIGELEYHYDSLHLKISKLSIKWNVYTLLNRRLKIDSLNAETIEYNKESLIKNIHLTGTINAQILKIDSLQLNYLDNLINGRMQIALAMPHALEGSIQLNPGNKTKSLLQGSANIGGDFNQLQWSGDFHGLLELTLNGTLKQFSELNQTIKWRTIEWPVSPQSSINSPEGRINITGKLPDIKIELTSKVNKDHQSNWQVNALATGVLPQKWDFNATIAQTQSPVSKMEGLYASIGIKGNIQDLRKGDVAITLAPGHYQMPKDSSFPSLQFTGGVINASLAKNVLSGKGSLNIDANTSMKLKFNLPDFKLDSGLSSKQPISAELNLLFNSFEFIKSFSPEISNPKGHLVASLKAKGTLEKMLFESKIHLNNASVSLPGFGLNLNPIDITFLAKKNKWNIDGMIGSAGKKLLLKGAGILNETPSGEFSLQGSDFPVMNTREYQISISPQIKITASPSNLNIAGIITIPFAQIKPQSFSNSIAVSEDIVFNTKQEEAPKTPFNTNMDLSIEMGEHVELTFKGLHANLGGTVHLKQLSQGPVNANGELNVLKGEYKAYGQDLAIEQGEIIFTGGRIDNPGINLRAAKKIDTTSSSVTSSNQLFDFNNNNLQNANLRGNISVGVEVSGRISDPKIQLFSNPSILSQADILSMLVLGRPASQANKAGGQLLLAAISSMNIGTGTNGAQLMEQLKQNLGFDFNVQTNSNYNLVTNQVSDNTALVVGKAISKRVYLSYNVGLSQADPNVLTLKYLLNKFLSIQVTSSDAGSGIDVLYTSNK